MSVIINWDRVEKLCLLHCTQQEIAYVENVTIGTLNRLCLEQNGERFTDFYNAKRAMGKMSLRRRLWQKAEEGDTKMLLFLAKNWLGMLETPPAEKEAPAEEKVKVVFESNGREVTAEPGDGPNIH